MGGMDRRTGKPLSDRAHILQSLEDILTTDKGLRVMLREYGGDVSSLVDKPTNELFHVELYASVATVIMKWEPRFKLDSVTLDERTPEGRVILTLIGTILINNEVVKLEGIVI